MSSSEVDGLKAEIARLRKENDVQRATIDELVGALSSANQLCIQLTETLSKHRRS